VNLYLAASRNELDEWCGDHYEPGGVAELVVARNRSQARWLAWKKYRRNSEYTTPLDMPPMRTKMQVRDVEGPARIASSEYSEIEDDNLRLWLFDEAEAEMAIRANTAET